MEEKHEGILDQLSAPDAMINFSTSLDIGHLFSICRYFNCDKERNETGTRSGPRLKSIKESITAEEDVDCRISQITI